MNPGLILLSAALLLSGLVTVLTLRFAARLGLIQAPNQRSSHEVPTPGGGGVGMAVAGVVSGLWVATQSAQPQAWLALAGAGGILALVGFRDDVAPVSARVRFLVQIGVCATLLIVLPPLPPLVLPGGWSLSGAMLLAPLLFIGIWWVNLFNFMDGVDGLASVQALFMAVGGAVLTAVVAPAVPDSHPIWLWNLALVGAIAGFLPFNWPPAKIFMGDVGSTFLAFSLFALALLSASAGWLPLTTWLILAAVFVSDATSTLLRRMMAGERWLQAHRSHAYQHLARRWHGPRKRGHRRVTCLVLAVNVLWLAPLAAASVAWPKWQWAFAVLAYLPLLAAAVRLGAGRPETADSQSNT
ncbi:putative undecaprenyl-phosphate N-acetylglucosaminyl 1-phosphate transferase [compost metagenome]